MNLEQFQCLLSNLQSPNNEERINAEEIYKNLLNSNGMMVVSFLIQISQTNNNLLIYSLLLLKIIFNKYPEIFLSNASNDQQIQSFLLNLIDNPSEIQVIQLNISNLIIEAAKIYIQNQRWESFQSDIIQRCSSQNKFTSCISLDCISPLIHLGFLNVQMITPLLDEWYQMIWPSEPSYSHLLIIRLIFILAKNNCVCQCFLDFINCFPSFIFNLPSQFAKTVLSNLTDYTDMIYTFFGQNFNSLFECFINIFSDCQRDTGEREQVLEILVEISNNNKSEMYQYAEAIFSSLMSVICEISGPDYINEDYEDPTPRTSAEDSIRRFSGYFYNQNENEFPVFLFNVFNHFNEMADSPEKIRASYVLMRETMDLLINFFQDGNTCEILVRKIINGLRFPNIFCQFAALQVLSNASRYLPDFQKNYNPEILQELLPYIQSNLSSSQFALEALLYIISGSDDKDIEEYLDLLYQLLISIFNQIPISSQVFDLKCISSLITKTGNKMEQYYDIILPHLVSVIQLNNLKLTLPAIEAFSMIGFVDVSEQFINDSKKFIDFILTIKRENFTDDQNNTISSAISALVTKIGDHYPDSFAQLMLSVIEIINQPIAPQQLPLTSDRSDINDEVLIPNETENILYVYNRNQIDEVDRSLMTLNSFILKIGSFIIPYYQNLIEVFARTISYFFDYDIQCDAIIGLNAIIERNNFDNYNPFILVIESFNGVIMNNFQDLEIVVQFLDFATTLIKHITNLAAIESRFLESLLLLSMRSIEKCKIEEESQMIIFLNSAKIIKFITECHQINDQINEKLLSISQNEFPLSLEVSPFLIPGIATFWSSFSANVLHNSEVFNGVIQFICQELDELDSDTKEIVLMTLPDIIKSSLFTKNNANMIVSNLANFLSAIDECDSELKNSIDASVYVLTCLFKKYPSFINNQDIINLWFKSLPLKKKQDSCFKEVYDFLLFLMSQNHPIVTQDLVQLLRIIAKAVRGANSSDQAKGNFKVFLQSIISNPQSKDLFDSSFAQLDSKNEESIRMLLKET